MIKNKTFLYIHKLQQYLKIDLIYLIKGEFWIIIDKIISIVTSFLLALAWANWIDKNTYGNYQYILSVVGIISIFSLPEMGKAVTQAIARGYEGAFLRGFKTKLKWGTLTSLSALCIAGYYWLSGNENLPLAFLIIALLMPLFKALIVYIDFLTGKKRFDIQTKYNATTQIIAAIIMIFALFVVKSFLSETPNAIILLLLVSTYFVSRTFLRFFFFLRTKTKFKPNRQEDPKTVPFGKHLTLTGIIDIAANRLDAILLFHFLGATELAIYFFATLIPKQINAFIADTNVLALPKFSVRSRALIKKNILKKICYFIIFISLIVLVYVALAPFIYNTFFPKYSDAIPYTKLYALSLIPLCFSIIGVALRAKMMTKQIYQIRISASLIRVGLFFILIPLYGTWGAVLGILGTRIAHAFLFLLFLRKI